MEFFSVSWSVSPQASGIGLLLPASIGRSGSVGHHSCEGDGETLVPYLAARGRSGSTGSAVVAEAGSSTVPTTTRSG